MKPPTYVPDFNVGDHTYKIPAWPLKLPPVAMPVGGPLDSVTKILSRGGLCDNQWFTEESAWRGSMVHKACEYDDHSELDESTLADEWRGYVAAWRRFKADTGFKPLLVEQPLYHPSMLYAGTLDAAGVFPDGTVGIADRKSGAITPAARIQTAAYAELLRVSGWLDSGFRYPAIRRMAVAIRPDGTYSLPRGGEYPIAEQSRDLAVFTAALTINNWRIVNRV